MSSREPPWNHILDVIVTSKLRGVHTAMMGEIRSYSEPNQTAQVTLAVQLESVEGVFEDVPPLEAPVLWPGAWAAGDRCLLVFCEESFAKWFDTGSVEPPDVLRRHGLHAVCIPLVAPAGAAVQFVALANLVTEQLQALKDAISGAVPVPNDGGAALQSTILAALTTWPGSVAAQKVKAR